MREGEYQKKRRVSKASRKAQMLDLLATGLSTKKACEALGCAVQNYYQWRWEDPDFARQCTMLRLGSKHMAGASFVEFRKSFFGHDTPWHHQHILDAMEQTPPGGITMILAPPSAGKTTFFVDYVCVPPDHEILTRRGWLRYGDLVDGELVMSFDPQTHAMRWEPLLGVVEFDFDGELWTLDRQRGGSFEFTKDHRWPYMTRSGRRGIAAADELPIAARLPLKGEFSDDGSTLLSSRLAAILGWVVTDGHAYPDGSRAQVYQNPEKHLREIVALLGTKPHTPRSWGTTGVPVGRQDWKQIRKVFDDKSDLPTIVTQLSRSAAEAMWDAMFKAEGSMTRGRWPVFSQKDGPVKEAFQILSVMTGRNATISAGQMNVTVTSRVAVNAQFGRRQYAGKVWCPTTATGTWVMRHDGAVIPTGNCWKVAKNPDYRVGFVSESANHARKLVGQIARRMTDEEEFKAFIAGYGPFYKGRSGGRTWTQNQLLVAKATHDEKDPTVEARGAGAQIYGARLDDIVFDDIQSTQSLNETDKLLRYFGQDALTRIKKGRLFIIGTRVGPQDLYETLMDRLPMMRVVKIPAIVTDQRGENPESYWPEMWPLDELMQRKDLLDRLGGDTWARVYQQEPVSEATATFTPEALAFARTKERRVGQPAGVEIIMSPDPNLGVGVNALTVWGFDADRLYLIDVATRAKVARTEDIVSFLGEYASRYRPTTLIIEHNRERGLPTDEWLVAASKHYGFRIKTHQTGNNKVNPIYGVASMAGGFSHGEISLPDMDDESRQRLAPYMSELLAWRPDVPTKLLKQDMVMSGWFAWLHFLEHKDAIANRNRPRQLWRPTWIKQPA